MRKLIAALLLSLSFILGMPMVAFASPVAPAAAPGSATCVFESGVTENCQSTNPHIVLNLHNTGDTSQCMFAVEVDWGDGSGVQDFTIPGGPDGSEHLSDHIYAVPFGIYPIVATGQVLSGPCTFNTGNYQFTFSPSACPAGTTPVGKDKTAPDYCAPKNLKKWDTQPVKEFTPGVEPLNIIISAHSNIPLSSILAALSGWEAVPTGTALPACLSPEKADVTGNGYITQQASWRTEVLAAPCYSGNILSAFGQENHARIWNQPVPGSEFGAWFISASYETACVKIKKDMEPLVPSHLNYLPDKNLLWHCIDGSKNPDGSKSSYSSNGYNHGASALVSDLEHAAEDQDWLISTRKDTRPAGVGEGGVPFNGTVYIVTINSNPLD